MTSAARERLLVRVPMLLISAAAWILLAIEPGGTVAVAHCSSMLAATTATVSPGLRLALNPSASLSVGWVVMLAAMMAPLLIAPVRHVRDRSFARRRARAIVLFVAGYGAIWIAAGVILVALAATIQLSFPQSSAVALVTIAAVVWQFSPAKQGCLNRGHAHPELAAFGTAADIGALRFGVTHGLWCVGSCWAVMLVPLLITQGHVPAMAVVTLWLVTERLDGPMPPRWRVRGPDKAARLAVAQMRTRMRLQRS